MNKTIAIIILLFLFFLSSLSQILLKKSSNKTHKNLLREYLNPYVILSYLILFSTTLISSLILKYINLSLFPVLESSSFIFVIFLSKIFLNENINKKQLFALLLIIIGIIVFAVI